MAKKWKWENLISCQRPLRLNWTQNQPTAFNKSKEIYYVRQLHLKVLHISSNLVFALYNIYCPFQRQHCQMWYLQTHKVSKEGPTIINKQNFQRPSFENKQTIIRHQTNKCSQAELLTWIILHQWMWGWIWTSLYEMMVGDTMINIVMIIFAMIIIAMIIIIAMSIIIAMIFKSLLSEFIVIIVG